METLINCRMAWHKIRDTVALKAANEGLSSEHRAEATQQQYLDVVTKKNNRRNAEKSMSVSEEKKKKKKVDKDKAIEKSVADLYDLPLQASKARRRTQAVATIKDGDNSDFGEEDALDVRTAAEKAARKKSLKFYTSQIVQKSNKRAGAGRDAGGDMDLPYRERLKDRQARLLAEAERRGKKGSKHGVDLGDDSEEDDSAAAGAVRDDADEYYDMVAQKSKDKGKTKQRDMQRMQQQARRTELLRQRRLVKTVRGRSIMLLRKIRGWHRRGQRMSGTLESRRGSNSRPSKRS